MLLYVHENVPQVRIDARTAEVFARIWAQRRCGKDSFKPNRAIRD